MARPSVAVIHLDNIAHNYRLAQQLTASGQAIAVVKANAYGHGVVEVAQHLASMAPAFAVCSCEEAAQLRLNGIDQPILLLEGPFAADDVVFASQQNCWLTIADESHLDTLASTVITNPVVIFLKVDTGMHRLGISPDRVDSILSRLHDMPQVAGAPLLMTHFACADESQHPLTMKQLNLLDLLAEKTQLAVSSANSAAILTGRGRGDSWSRPGIMLYGADPLDAANDHSRQLRPAMSLLSEVIAMRDVPEGDSVGYGAAWVAERPSRIATVAIGYADGYPRSAASGTPVLVAGQLCPLVGRVSMDMICVDVTDAPQVVIGSDVELWGQQLSIDVVADHANTIAYELTARMPMRTPRVYRSHSE